MTWNLTYVRSTEVIFQFSPKWADKVRAQKVIFQLCQKWSDFAHIWCVKSTHEKISSHRFSAKSDHFWWSPKILNPSPKMVRFCWNSMWWNLSMSWFHTPNMSKIGPFLTISKTSDPFILIIRQKCVPNFWYVARKRPIYLKSGPKVLGNRGYWDIFFTGISDFRKFRCSLSGCVWA